MPGSQAGRGAGIPILSAIRTSSGEEFRTQFARKLAVVSLYGSFAGLDFGIGESPPVSALFRSSRKSRAELRRAEIIDSGGSAEL
jgi:hypothetical protein